MTQSLFYLYPELHAELEDEFESDISYTMKLTKNYVATQSNVSHQMLLYMSQHALQVLTIVHSHLATEI